MLKHGIVQIRFLFLFALLFSLSAPAIAADESAARGAEHYWPQWRGPWATGVAPHADPPLEWSESKNIRWKIPLPGEGHSTPVIWGERIFVTTAAPFGEELPARYSDAPGAHDIRLVTQHHRFIVIAVNRRDGKVLWQRVVKEAHPREGHHVTASFASASPITDGERLYAFFGSYGLYCLDLNGEPLWEKDLGELRTLHAHGEGSSPALYGDALIVNWDHEGESFLVALDKRTGEQRWKTGRRVRSTSWSAPIVVECAGGPQVIVSGSERVSAYDPADGKIIWECGGMSVENVVASPVSNGEMVFAGCSYDKRVMLAIRLDGAKGDISGTDQIAWRRVQGAPYVPSPLLYGDALYFLAQFQGPLTRVAARTGENQPGTIRLDGLYRVFASPVGAAGRVYITDRNGSTLVIRHGAQPEILALNKLDDSFSASAALAGKELYLRGQNLYCIAEE